MVLAISKGITTMSKEFGGKQRLEKGFHGPRGDALFPDLQRDSQIPNRVQLRQPEVEKHPELGHFHRHNVERRFPRPAFRKGCLRQLEGIFRSNDKTSKRV